MAAGTLCNTFARLPAIRNPPNSRSAPAQTDSPVVSFCRIPSGLILPPNQKHFPAVPPHQEGRFAIVTNVGAGCGGRVGAQDECADRGRRSRVVLTSRR